MTGTASADRLHLRRYGADGDRHRHDHVQVVLPVLGGMELEIGGRGGRIGAGHAAFVAPGVDHAQSAHGENRFLVLDCAPQRLGEARVEQLRRRPFVPLTPVLRRLAAYVDRAGAGIRVPAPLAGHCLPLLLRELAGDTSGLSRLRPLCRRIESRLGEPWTVARMAAEIGLGASRLHALFLRELGQTPQQWLAALRLDRARAQLAGSDRPIARIALENGWSEQSALTRALRRASGMTPAAYRRLHRAHDQDRADG